MLQIKNFRYNMDAGNNLIAWQVLGQITIDEANKISDFIKKEVLALQKGHVKLFVDNRPMEQEGRHITFKPEVSAVWTELQQWLLEYCSNVAVVCGSMMMQAQMNRLAKNSGLSEVLKAFWAPNSEKAVDEAILFIRISNDSIKGWINSLE